MIRSRRPIPPYIRNLEPSAIKGGMYDILWEGIIYTIPRELAVPLANYFKNQKVEDPSMTDWFAALPPEQQRLVLRTDKV